VKVFYPVRYSFRQIALEEKESSEYKSLSPLPSPSPSPSSPSSMFHQ